MSRAAQPALPTTLNHRSTAAKFSFLNGDQSMSVLVIFIDKVTQREEKYISHRTTWRNLRSINRGQNPDFHMARYSSHGSMSRVDRYRIQFDHIPRMGRQQNKRSARLWYIWIISIQNLSKWCSTILMNGFSLISCQGVILFLVLSH